MRVFISWSGERSHQVALAFRDWLPVILQHVKPWMSEADISAGDRWSVELSKQLEESEFGIICLTKDNLQAPWILFEAGAISKSLSSGAVCPYLLDLELKDISGPLAQFQAKKSDRDSTFELLNGINNKSKSPVNQDVIKTLFDRVWEDFESKLKEVVPLGEEQNSSHSRPDSEVLEDLVLSIRRLEKAFSDLREGMLQVSVEDQVKVSDVAVVEKLKESLKQNIKSGRLALEDLQKDCRALEYELESLGKDKSAEAEAEREALQRNLDEKRGIRNLLDAELKDLIGQYINLWGSFEFTSDS